jgi:hypothetical protein
MTRRPFAIVPRVSRTKLGWVYLRWGRGRWLFSDTRPLHQRIATRLGFLP